MSTDAPQSPSNHHDDNTKQNNSSDPSSHSKSRRRRRRNKNKNNNKQSNKTKAKAMRHQQTRLHSNKTGKQKKTPWHSVNNSSKFENIMNEQKVTNNPYIIYNDTSTHDQDLLEQQMILQSIIESNKLKQKEQSTKDDDEKKETIHKQTKNELITADADQSMSDEMLAVYLQQQEQHKLLHKQKMSEMHDGKYGKVTSSSAHSTAIPKSALKFYYDDASMMNGYGMKKEEYKGYQDKEEMNGNERVMEESVAISKHDAKIWSETHLSRLNEYDGAGGNLDTQLMISNQAYNSFRNQLDKKGFINYNNYQLQPKDTKR